MASNMNTMTSAGPGLDPTTARRRHPEPYFSSAQHGFVYYSPRNPLDRRRRSSVASSVGSPSFPAPLIQPRQRRPHSIHIVSFPPGFIPQDLRQKPPPLLGKSSTASAKRKKKKEKAEEKARAKREVKERKKLSRLSASGLKEGGARKRVLGKILAVFLVSWSSVLSEHSANTNPPENPSPQPAPRPRSRPLSIVSFARRMSWIEPDEPVLREVVRGAAPVQQNTVSQEFPLPTDPTVEPEAASGMTMMDTMRTSLPGGGCSGHRNNTVSTAAAKNIMNSSVTEIQKPVASGSGLTCSIVLAESNVFLTGFDHDGHSRLESHNSSALLRGKLLLNVSKNVKIKSVTLKFVGKARTDWPEGIPPLKMDMFEEETLRMQNLVFFHAMHEGIWEMEYGNQCTFALKSCKDLRPAFNLNPSNLSNVSLSIGHRNYDSNLLSAKELKRLSLHSVQSRSFGKGESPLANQVQAKGYKVFQPGTYEYAFELPIDHHQLETTRLQYGSVKWKLEAIVERAGAFKPRLHGTKEVSIVRVPDQMSLEMSEPISISRQWEDQLHYDIMISGKSFPIGTRIPIAFKLTPLAKVQVHKLRVFATESIEYWTNDRKVTRKDSGRKILLLEKTAGKPLDKQFHSSEVRVLTGGELEPDRRQEARRLAMARRNMEAARAGRHPEPLPDVTENILGDLELGLESFWGSTEIEMNVQIPTCEMMGRDRALRLHADCSWKNVNVYHWIKIVMRISRADPEDSTGKRRRHFEISIDSPFTVLNCRATQANTSLPQYGGPDGPGDRAPRACGCPDSNVVNRSPSSSSGHLNEFGTPNASRMRLDRVSTNAMPVFPQAAHLHSQPSPPRSNVGPAGTAISSQAFTSQHSDSEPRPIHLIRCPSYLPPAIDADDPPPPLQLEITTPPPNYDLIVGTPSVDGLADYFSRLADYEDSSRYATPQEDNTPEATTPHVSTAESITSAKAVVAPARGICRVLSTAGAGISSGIAAASASALASADEQDEQDDNLSDSGDEDDARPHKRGRVNVVNPRTPGSRLAPSRSQEFQRPVLRLDMTGVVRRGRLPQTIA